MANKAEVKLIFIQREDDESVFDVWLHGIIVEQCYEADISDVKERYKKANKNLVKLSFAIQYNKKQKAIKDKQTIANKIMRKIDGYYLNKDEDEIIYIRTSYDEDKDEIRFYFASNYHVFNHETHDWDYYDTFKLPALDTSSIVLSECKDIKDYILRDFIELETEDFEMFEKDINEFKTTLFKSLRLLKEDKK